MPLKCFANYPTCYFQGTIHAVIIQFLNLLMQSFSWKKFITFVQWTFKGAIDALRSVLMMQKWASVRAKCLKFLHHVIFSLCYNLSTFVWNCSRLEPLRFYGLTVFVSKTYMYVLSNPFSYFVLFWSVFNCYFDFSKQHFTKDKNEKIKPQP